MEFSLPATNDISIEIDGRRFDGTWYVILGDMIVNYNGHTASVSERQSDANDIAVKMLRELVREHYVPIGMLSPTIPSAIRNAAHNYVNSFDDDQPTRDLVSSFGRSDAGSETHRQLSWLCANAAGMIVPFWKLMCDTDTPEKTFQSLRLWLDDPGTPVDWDSARSPNVATRDGERVVDCDACRLEPITNAVASTAGYLQSADASLAVDALLATASAYDEGCHSENSPDRFEKWLVIHALPCAIACKPVH